MSKIENLLTGIRRCGRIARQVSEGSVRIACHVLEVYVRIACRKVISLSEFLKIAMCLGNLTFSLFLEIFKF
jgi:hypothetical protein